LIFLDESAKIHENHSVIPIKLLENKNVKDTIDEYKKLFISKENVDNLIKLCNLKLKEMEIEKNQLINNLDLATRNIFDKIDVKILNVRNKYIGIKAKNEELTWALETTPIALQNIVKTKDYGQNEKIYEHLNNIKKGLKNTEYISNNNNILNTNIKNNCVESFTSEEFEFELPYNGKYVDKKIIFVKKLDNLIPENECHISLKYDSDHICFNVRIINNKKKINQDKVKYYGYIIIRNQKYDCEFIVMEDKISIDMHILNIQFSSNHFISFKDENNKIRFKIYIMKLEKK
jgi:predicted Zn-ribbon and HTH transcriptional regulator